MPKNHTLGILDADTDEVPGTVLLLGGTSQEPLGLDTIERKRTADGIILDPQPDDHPDDPLNWASWRRDLALICLSWHCLIGGGQTPVLAAGFPEVADTYNVDIPSVALTTGLYMLGLGIGCVITSPTAILFGKRPVYLAGVVLFCVSSVWCALSPSYPSLVIARIVMGIGVSPCESLPSATIAEIFFLHERAYRVGIYTLLLLGGKNLVPLVSAAVINTMGWRWVFWIVAMIVGLNLALLFFFVPETFWDRTPRPKPSGGKGFLRRVSSSMFSHSSKRSNSRSRSKISGEKDPAPKTATDGPEITRTVSAEGRQTDSHARFGEITRVTDEKHDLDGVPTAREVYQMDKEKTSRASLDQYVREAAIEPIPSEKKEAPAAAPQAADAEATSITPKPFSAGLKIWQGRIREGSWTKAAVRPFILFAYPAVLWSTVVYSFSIGWLIVLSESVAHIYQENPYNFTPLGTGLVYLSPFIGGILGTAVAGKVSDILVRIMCKRNAGIYEPEFRLVMGIPVAITTAIGLMGFGWSAQEHDKWIVPTVFFGIISFGCSLGSTTAITFCVDSYRQYAGEALVTLNFSKNVLHGFIFSLFFNHWLDKDGPKMTFVALGIIQVGALLFTIPLYMYGKRLRLWTVEKNLMAKWT
ncbi:putative MFS transporter [Geopyxis carbonaria]|nr:putative MFS transporter [Geopyxis carbonaria]